MIIKINGNTVDFTLESEKTVSQIMTSIEQWLSGSGHRVSGISIDDKVIDSSSLEKVFAMDIDSINILDIKTSSLADLTAESLYTILNDINEFQSLKYEDKKKFIETWQISPQAAFIAESMPDLFNIITNSFSGTGLNTSAIFAITEERLREVKDPKEELNKLKKVLDDTCTRLTDFSLDLQTGKDLKASGTIQLFSGVTEKLLRLANQLELQGYLLKNKSEKPLAEIIDELSKIIKELYDAYERHDTVLAGDLAEYEACPKLQELHSALNTTANREK